MTWCIHYATLRVTSKLGITPETGPRDWSFENQFTLFQSSGTKPKIQC